jgi:hypothetical protein
MRKSAVIVIVIGATAIAVAVGVAATAAPRITDRSGPAPSSTVLAGAHVSLDAAKQMALSVVPGGTVIQVESDDVHDRPVWKVIVAAPTGRVVVSIDAATGQVLEQQPSGSDDTTATPATGTPDDGVGHDIGDDHGGDNQGGTGGHGRGTDDGPGHA